MQTLVRSFFAASLFAGLGLLPFTASSAQETATLERFTLPETDEGLAGEGPIRRYDWFKNLWQKRRSEFRGSGSGRARGGRFSW